MSLSEKLHINQFEKVLLYGLAIALFAVLNVVISPLSMKYDFSNGSVYTLSKSTTIIVKNLDDLVTITFFVSSDIPTRLIPLKTEITDLLNEYQKAGGKHIRILVLDPKKDKDALNKAKLAGLQELQFSQMESDKYAVTNAYFGISMAYENKKELVPQITEPGNLEYNLTAAIYKMTNKNIDRISLGGIDLENAPQSQPFTTLNNVLSKQYQINFLPLENTFKNINKAGKTILLFDNTQKKYDDKDIQALESFINSKGSVIAFVDGVWVQDSLNTQPAAHNLNSLFSRYGITINNDLVLSTSSELVNFGNENVSFFTPYPLWVRTNKFDTSQSLFANINYVTFPWVSSLSVKNVKDMYTSKIISTVPKSWNQKGTFILNPQEIQPPKSFSEYTLGAKVNIKNGGTLIVIPSSRFAQDRYLSQNSSNVSLILNMVNDLTSGGALSGIHQRNVAFYALPDLNEQQKDAFKYIVVLALPLLYIGYGIKTYLSDRKSMQS